MSCSFGNLKKSMSKVLVYGGCGGLGRVVVDQFKKASWNVTSIDLAENTEAHHNVKVDPAADFEGQSNSIKDQVAKLVDSSKFDAIVCVAGGWAGGNAASDDVVKNADLMIKQSIWTSLISGHVASKHLKQGGLLVLTGADAAKGPTPGMMGYGLAKAAVHQLVGSFASSDSGLPADSTVCAILPITLDTPMNRKFMPDADHSTWTPLETVADKMFKWASGAEKVESGSLVSLKTKGGETSFEVSK